MRPGKVHVTRKEFDSRYQNGAIWPVVIAMNEAIPKVSKPLDTSTKSIKKSAKRVIHMKKSKKCSNSVWEKDTSMSPRCSEMLTCFEKVRMPLRIAPLLEAGPSLGPGLGPFGAGRCVY